VSSLRRIFLLLGARRALAHGAPERALAALDDPELDLSAAARALRSRVLDALCRTAVLRSAQGREHSVARLYRLVAERSASRAFEFRTRLAWAGTSVPLLAVAPGEDAAQAGGRTGSRAELRAPPAPAEEPGPAAPRAPASFELAVDDGGQHLVLTGERVTIGHLQSGRADLGFLADVGPEHARLESSVSLRGGPVWRIVPLGGVELRAGGEPVVARGRELASGDVVELAVNLAFRFHAPDPASRSARLELLRGAECAGSSSVLLFGAGRGGRLSIGPLRRAHVRVARLEREVTLERSAGALVLASEAGVCPIDGAVAPAHDLVFPLERRHDFLVGRPGPGGPPHALSIGPVPTPGGRVA
jgi:hypothetical protein